MHAVTYDFIGALYTSFKGKKKKHTPMQSWPYSKEYGEAHVFQKYARMLKGIEEFNFLKLIWYPHEAHDTFTLEIMNKDGIRRGTAASYTVEGFNPLGISIVERVEKMEILNLPDTNNLVVPFIGADMFYRTPLIKIKPCTKIVDGIKEASNGWIKPSYLSSGPRV